MTTQFDWNAFEKENQPKTETKGFDWAAFEKKNQKPSFKEDLTEAAKETGRTALGAAVGRANFTRYGILTGAQQALGTAEAIQELDDLEERLPDLKKKFPQLQFPEKIDREKYMQAVQAAGELVPTPHNLREAVGKFLNTELKPDSKIGKIIEFASGIAKAASGTIAQKAANAAITTALKEGAEHAGLPEPLADFLATGVSLGGKVAENLEHKLPEKGPSLPKEKLASAEAEIITPKGKTPGGEPPPPPSGPSPGLFKKGEKISEGLVKAEELPRSKFEVAETAINNIKHDVNAKPLPAQITSKIKPHGEEKAALTSERINVAPELGEVISKDNFYTEAQAGRNLSSKIKKNAEDQRKIIKVAYKEAEEVTKNHYDTFADIAEDVDEIITRLDRLESKNPGQQVVYDKAKSVRNLVGRRDNYIEANAYDLMKQADSLSEIANYDMPYSGAKQEIKRIVKSINNAVIKSLEKSGLQAEKVKKADKIYSDFADAYLGDEVAPFLDRKILNPEALYRSALKDEASYRAVKKAIGSRNHDLVNKLDRTIVEQKLGKYYKDPKLVNTKEYITDLSNLSEFIGKEKTAEVDHALRKKQTESREGFRAKQILREEKGNAKPSGRTKLDVLADKVASHSKLTPESIINKLETRSGIKELKKTLTERDFDILTKQHLRDILRESKITKKSSATDVFDVLNKEKNYELFSEILGEEVTHDALMQARKASAGEQTLVAALNLPGVKPIGRFVKAVYNFIQAAAPALD